MVKYIIIEIDGKELTLSSDKAEKLYDELHKLYGSKNQMPVPFGPYDPPIEPYKYPWDSDKPVITWGPNSTYTDGGLYSIAIK